MTRTLHVHIGPRPERTDLEESLAAIDAGDDTSTAPSRLTVESLETFNRVFRPTNLELLQAIAKHDPGSIRELARLVDRHPPEVTENVAELENYGLIEVETEGRSKRPRVWYDEISVEGDVSLQGSDTETAPA
jgi:predicted transcriptional regulator